MSKIPLYSYCTPSHHVFRDEWFLPTMGDEYDVRIHTGAQICSSATYKSKDWNKSMYQKACVIADAMEECEGQVFVFSDVDVQFFGKTREYLLAAVADCDIAFQANNSQGVICAGFFVCRASPAVRNFWQEVQAKIGKYREDQESINYLLRGNNTLLAALEKLHVANLYGKSRRDGEVFVSREFGVRWRLLGEEIWLPGKLWKPGDVLDIPPNILVHHANWTKGIENKIAQLRYVRDLVEKRSHSALVQMHSAQEIV